MLTKSINTAGGAQSSNVLNHAISKMKENVTNSSGHNNKYIGGGGYVGNNSERDESSLNTTPNSK